MRTSPAISILEGSGYSECLDRLSASGGVPRPLATYRLQLSADFRFADAERLLPYLDALGVTHLYVSPILQARAGSRDAPQNAAAGTGGAVWRRAGGRQAQTDLLAGRGQVCGGVLREPLSHRSANLSLGVCYPAAASGLLHRTRQGSAGATRTERVARFAV